jgi:hypothetical protein
MSKIDVKSILNSLVKNDSTSCFAFFGFRIIMKSMPARTHTPNEPRTAPCTVLARLESNVSSERAITESWAPSEPEILRGTTALISSWYAPGSLRAVPGISALNEPLPAYRNVMLRDSELAAVDFQSRSLSCWSRSIRSRSQSYVTTVTMRLVAAGMRESVTGWRSSLDEMAISF